MFQRNQIQGVIGLYAYQKKDGEEALIFPENNLSSQSEMHIARWDLTKSNGIILSFIMLILEDSK